MKNTALLITALIAASATAETYAQRDSRLEHDVVTAVNNDTVDMTRVEKYLKENAPVSPNDNGLPRFAIVGKDHKFYIGLGAQFLGEGVFDFGDEMPSPLLFTPSAITPSTPGNRSSLGFAWQSSSIYLNALALTGTDNQVGVFFKMNFLGNNNSANVFHFYAKYRGLTVGYTTSVFADGAAEPMTIDFEGPNGYPFITLFTASWTQKFTDHLSGAIGIEAPTISMTTGNGASDVNQRIPAIPLYLQYAWDGGASHVRLSGLVRSMQYRNDISDSNKTMAGLGVQLSGVTKIAGPLSASFNAAYGSGIGSYLQDDNGLGLDAVSTTEKGKMKLVRSMGITAGLNYVFTPKLSGNLVYSHLSNWLPSDAAVQNSLYRYGDYIAANLIYSINKFVSAGIEYDYGHRKSFDAASLHTNRLQLQFGVTF